MYGQNKDDSQLDAARAGAGGGYLAITADTTLVAADAGVVTWVSNGIDVTLPAHEKGLTFHFIQSAAYSTAVCQVISADGNDWLGQINAVTGIGDPSTTTDDKVIWGSGTLAGDMISIVSTGSKWIVYNSFSSVTSNGVIFG